MESMGKVGRFIFDVIVVVVVLALVTVFVVNVGKWDAVRTFAAEVFGEPAGEALDGWADDSQEGVEDALEAGEDLKNRIESGELYEVDWSTVTDALDQFKPQIPERHPDYERDEFGSGWLDTDNNGCDTRNDILARDLTRIALDSDDCTVLSGTLDDPYTGETIDFERGRSTSSAVQIDHMVPLSLAWDLGAWKWSEEKREQFANDPVNLYAVDGPANGSKSDNPISEWMPPNEEWWCQYTASYVLVHDKYDLAMDEPDQARAAELVEACA